MIAKSHRWQKTALVAATTAVLALWGSSASALSLGRIAVISALGEPLRAEIDILDINAEEAASLKTSVASPETFRSSGMEYNAAISGLQISLQKRPDGRSYLRISSDRAVNDPFVDLILEASWSSGRIVRDYTMLFDPPNLRQAQPLAPFAPQVSPAPGRPAAPTGSAEAARPAPTSRPAKAMAESAPPKPGAPAGKPVTVKAGDIASRIAAANKPAGVSLDQMLVAMLRANPDAFMGGNINRLRAGVVIAMPDAEQALATPAREASQIVQTQSRDFSDYRSRLASNAPLSQVAAADRKASGSVQARVEDKKPVAAAPDKLTLSKGAVQGKASEDQMAKERSAKEAASRADELTKNIAELNKLSVASAPATPAEPPQAAASAPAMAASAPAVAASAPAKRPSMPAPAPMAEPGLLDELLDDPLVPAAAGGLVALLAGLGFYRIRQRKKAAQMDSSFLESRLQPDSFFGASGGQRVDTHDGSSTGSSMVYTPSQLDTNDVDPIAEADVYLAYGRDMQAEEILKEALRSHPDRIAVHQKLMEIYAKRRDLKSLEAIANQAYKVTGGQGADWERVCELGASVDPGNALYQADGQPSGQALPAAIATGSGQDTGLDTASPAPVQEPAAATADLDLDLDFSLDETPADTPAGTSQAGASDAPPALDLSFELPAETPAAAAASADTAANSLDFDVPALPEIQVDIPATKAEPAQAASAPPSDAGMLEFDLGTLSLDLGTPTAAQPAAPATDDPLATKLALAEEFHAIGDTDGARALIEEIIAEATGDMKAKAQNALSKLS